SRSCQCLRASAMPMAVRMASSAGRGSPCSLAARLLGAGEASARRLAWALRRKGDSVIRPLDDDAVHRVEGIHYMVEDFAGLRDGALHGFDSAAMRFGGGVEIAHRTVERAEALGGRGEGVAERAQLVVGGAGGFFQSVEFFGCRAYGFAERPQILMGGVQGMIERAELLAGGGHRFAERAQLVVGGAGGFFQSVEFFGCRAYGFAERAQILMGGVQGLIEGAELLVGGGHRLAERPEGLRCGRDRRRVL